MLKLEKLYIENFKGVTGPKTIEFNSFDLSILNGPNGFGKTTVFDAIELCLRGKIERTVQFGNVQKNNHHYKKPFYQNSIGRDVVLKVMFKDNQTGENHVIVKVLDKNHDGKIGNSKAFRTDAWDILESYYSDDVTKFDSPFSKGDYVATDQAKIDILFYKDVDFSHHNLYPLFNYLQQEENIYFLKKDEEEKKAELDFLFQTRDQSSELDRLSTLSRNIRAIRDDLRLAILQLGETVNLGEPLPYLKLFEQKSLSYDLEEPFLSQPPQQLAVAYEAYVKELDTLEEFISTFSIDEYKKDKLREAIAYASQNRGILTAFVLQLLVNEEHFSQIEQLSRRRSTFIVMLKVLEDDRFDSKAVEDLGFSKEFVNGYSDLVSEKLRQKLSIGHIEGIISDLITVRAQTIEKANQLPTEILRDDFCPLCNAQYPSSDFLLKAVGAKTDSLMSFNQEQLLRLDILNAKIITEFRIPIIDQINLFLSAPENQLDDEFFKILLEFRGFSDRVSRFKLIIAAGNISYDQYILESPVSLSLLQETIDRLRLSMIGSLVQIVPDQSKLRHKELFKDLFTEDDKLLISLAEVHNKQRYLKFKYDEARMFSGNVLIDRLTRLVAVENRIFKIKDALTSSIREYKLMMIEKIKIPFYLYSGKILQNYQQGLGIFIDMQQNTNRVKFLTDGESDHDIIHHLSSGQLAVVSIAFCLALNKVYQTANHFKFIAIDDPVQTLDEINIHSFIELLRHEFNDYQVIISTHEDDIAAYLNYKFDVFNYSCKRINVQKEFYAS